MSDPRALVLRGLARIDRSPGAAAQGILRALLDGPDARGLDPRDKGLVTECFYGVLRWRLRLDRVIARHARQGVPDDPELANLLRFGVFQLLFLDRVPARAAVHTSVEMARKLRGEFVAKFVNGFLRAVDRSREEPEDLAERYGHPHWMVERFRRELGDDAQLEARLRANMTAPPVTLRLHPSTSWDALAGAVPTPTPGVVAFDGDPELVRHGTKMGHWLPQDEASARVALLLDVQPGDRVLELCAGRGVKTTQLAAAAGPTGLVVGLDQAAGRLAEARRLLSRWAPTARVHLLAADASAPLPLSPDLRFDRILVDAPCSGLGVIRRRPETLWRRKPTDVTHLAKLQARILAEAERWAAPGATLVYAVCTTTPEETLGVLGARSPVGGFVTTPERDGTDGFYAAKLAL